MSEDKVLISKPLTNQVLWDLAKVIVSRINTASGNTLSKYQIEELEGDWFDHLEEKLTLIEQ